MRQAVAAGGCYRPGKAPLAALRKASRSLCFRFLDNKQAEWLAICIGEIEVICLEASQGKLATKGKLAWARERAICMTLQQPLARLHRILLGQTITCSLAPPTVAVNGANQQFPLGPTKPASQSNANVSVCVCFLFLFVVVVVVIIM